MRAFLRRILHALFKLGSVIHERPVPFAYIRFVERPFDERKNLRIGYFFACVSEKEKNKHRADIRFDKDFGFVKRKGRYRARRIRTDPGKRFEEFSFAGKFSAVRSAHFPARFLQILRPPVVAEAVPVRKHIRKRRRSERGRIGKRFDPRFVFRDDAERLCLLQHHFRNEYFVRIARFPPRKNPRALFIIFNNRRSKIVYRVLSQCHAFCARHPLNRPFRQSRAMQAPKGYRPRSLQEFCIRCR